LVRPKTHVLPYFSALVRALLIDDLSCDSALREKPSEQASRTFRDFAVPLFGAVESALMMSKIPTSTDSGPDRLLTYRLIKRF
jgi:hypothetical protein